MKPSEILRAAILLITPRFAWFRGNWEGKNRIFGQRDFTVCYCADGAINKAATGTAFVFRENVTPELHQAKCALVDVINPFSSGEPSTMITLWNDNRKRDKRQVVRAMKKAARNLEKVGR